MEEIITKGAISSAGFFACIGLQGVNILISTVVGFATLLFLALSIIKLIKELKK